MPKSLQATIAANQLSTDEVVAGLVSISHPQIGASLRFVLDSDSLVSRGETYIPMVADILFGANIPGEASQAKLTLDHVDRTVYAAIADLDGPLTVDFELVIRSFPDDPIREHLGLEALNVQVSALQISADLFAGLYYTEAVPHLRFVPRLFPGIFRR